MFFNLIAFLIFLVIIFIIYHLLQRYNINWQNSLIIVASYVFYGWWDYRLLSLIIISSLTGYFIGKYLNENSNIRKRKLLLFTGIAINLGLLGFFKYYNFFIGSFESMLAILGWQVNYVSLNIILPVGISFYTFQTMSYIIDIYRREFEADSNIITFFAFISFFPKLVAGPIERAKNLLPQFDHHRTFNPDKVQDGLSQFLWGVFKKVVIADNVVEYVNMIFSSYKDYDFTLLTIGVFLFAIQIYCEFSGYSDMAIGISRVFGFSLKRNFAFPYFSRDIGEFWRRWHISLSSWFRDYVYIPLGGRKLGKYRHIFNILVTFVVSGFWYGANFTFLVWGLLHGIYYLLSMALNIPKHKGVTIAPGRLLPPLKDAVLMVVTFLMVLFAWIFFRADSLNSSFDFIAALFTNPFFNRSLWHSQFLFVLILSTILMLVEWVQRNCQHALELNHVNRIGRWTIYGLVTLSILLLGNFGKVDLLYFQF